MKTDDYIANPEDSQEMEVLVEDSLLPQESKELTEDITDKHSKCLEQPKDEHLPEPETSIENL